MTLVSQPILAVRASATKVRQAGLFEVLALANNGILLDLPGMAAHQRSAVVTVLAVIGHVLKRYGSGVDPGSSDELAAAWNTLFGEDALRLEAPDGEVAFLQPPTDPPTSRQSIESADLLLPGVEHEVKRMWETTPERALFAIIGFPAATQRERSSVGDANRPLMRADEFRRIARRRGGQSGRSLRPSVLSRKGQVVGKGPYGLVATLSPKRSAHTYRRPAEAVPRRGPGTTG